MIMKNFSGVLNINKEAGFTSHDVVAIVRKNLNRVKTGHTGTLDPDAEGVLPICIGNATKIATFLSSDIKEYVAVAALGVTTTTQDLTGDVVEKKDFVFDEAKITEVVNGFLGDYFQTPPMYSAIKVDGKKLYELARAGKHIDVEKRAIHIYEIEITKFLPPDKFQFRVLCSKGTYIRTLCSDIGEKLGCGGAMAHLTRTKSGIFKIENSISLEDFKNACTSGEVEKLITPIDQVLDLKKVIAKPQAEKFLYNGNIVSGNYLYDFDEGFLGDKNILVYDHCQHLIGIYEALQDENGKMFIKPSKMLV